MLTFSDIFWQDFEPYIIVARKNLPLYDERFRGWFNDKSTQLYDLYAHGYEYVVHPTAFNVHVPHVPSVSYHASLNISNFYRTVGISAHPVCTVPCFSYRIVTSLLKYTAAGPVPCIPACNVAKAQCICCCLAPTKCKRVPSSVWRRSLRHQLSWLCWVVKPYCRMGCNDDQPTWIIDTMTLCLRSPHTWPMTCIGRWLSRRTAPTWVLPA